jgi:hypothetical protein
MSLIEVVDFLSEVVPCLDKRVQVLVILIKMDIRRCPFQLTVLFNGSFAPNSKLLKSVEHIGRA